MPRVRRPRPWIVTFWTEDGVERRFKVSALDELEALQQARSLLVPSCPSSQRVERLRWTITERRKPPARLGRPPKKRP